MAWPVGGVPNQVLDDLITPAIWNAVSDAITVSAAAIVTTAGDTVQATGANALARLAIGAAKQILTPNAGATALEYINPPIKYVQLEPFSMADQIDTATGNGKAYLHIPADVGGFDLVEVHAEVQTAGTTNTLDIQIANVTQAADMLSTVITVDSGETGSDTAAAPPVIDAANDDVATNDLIRIDVDAIHTTPAKGLLVTLGFQEAGL